MSLSLVKRSLQLIESSNNKGNNKNHKSKQESVTSSNFNRVSPRSKNLKKHSKNITVIKTFNKLQKELEDNKNQDKTNENLERLKILSGNTTIENNKALQFFKRATKNKEVKIEKVEEQAQSVFTEEDFARFEREYVFD